MYTSSAVIWFRGNQVTAGNAFYIHRLLLTEHVVLFEKTFKQRLKLFAFKIKLKDKLGAKRLKFVSIFLQVVKFFLRRVHPAFYVKL